MYAECEPDADAVEDQIHAIDPIETVAEGGLGTLDGERQRNGKPDGISGGPTDMAKARVGAANSATCSRIRRCLSRCFTRNATPPCARTSPDG